MKPILTASVWQRFLSAILFLLIVNGALTAQQTDEMDLEMMQDQNLVAPVKVDGDVLFLVRGSTTFPASERAAAISKRIRKAASNPSLSVDSLKIHPGARWMPC